jgi:hypothetical protein
MKFKQALAVVCLTGLTGSISLLSISRAATQSSASSSSQSEHSLVSQGPRTQSTASISMFSPHDGGGSTPTKHHKLLLKKGLHPKASDALREINVPASQIMQTIGDASASKGVHLPDGNVNGKPYTAAVDLSTRGLSNAEVKKLLERLGRVGFAAWFRDPGHDGWPSGESEHIHAVYAGVPMKDRLDIQVRDYLHQKNGLSSHTKYEFYHWSIKAMKRVAHLFRNSN